MHMCSPTCEKLRQGGTFHETWHHISCPQWSHFVSETPAVNDPHDQSEFKRNFDKIFEDVTENKEDWEIARDGDVVAVLLPVEKYYDLLIRAGVAL